MYGNYRQQDFFWGALVGGAIATLTTLLFTTKKGKQIQNQISEKYQEIEDNVKNAVSSSAEKVEETADQVSKKIAHKPKEDSKLKDEPHSKDSK